MPLLPREAAVSWTLPRWPQKICVDDVVAMASMYTHRHGRRGQRRQQPQLQRRRRRHAPEPWPGAALAGAGEQRL